MRSIYFVALCTTMAHPNETAITKLRTKKKLLINMGFFAMSMYGVTLAEAEIFRPAF